MDTVIEQVFKLCESCDEPYLVQKDDDGYCQDCRIAQEEATVLTRDIKGVLMKQDYQISPTGPSDARIVIVVDAPTAREVSSGHVLGDDVEYGRLLNSIWLLSGCKERASTSRLS